MEVANVIYIGTGRDNLTVEIFRTTDEDPGVIMSHAADLEVGTSPELELVALHDTLAANEFGFRNRVQRSAPSIPPVL